MRYLNRYRDKFSVFCALAGLCTVAPDASASQSPTSNRRVEASALVSASVYDMWWAWTTREGLASFFAQDAALDLRVSGKWELYMAKSAPVGARGTEGCRLLAFVPYEMLCFEWSSPPSVPELRDAGELTRVMVRLEEIAPQRTLVTVTQLGFGAGEAWDRSVEYFERAWPHVLDRLQEVFAARSAALRQPSPVVSIKRTQDGAVTVRSHDGVPDRWQAFEVDLTAAVEDVWQVLATPAGMKRFMGNRGEPEIELKPGGQYAIWPGALNRVIAHVPGRMLAVTGSAPEAYPAVRKGDTWGVYILAPNGSGGTRLRLFSMGWRDQDDEWKKAYDYFLDANAVYLNSLHRHFGGTTPAAGEGRVIEWRCDVDAPAADVWALFTTKDGIESWMAPVCEVDFRVGGTIRTNYDKAAGIGGPGTIVHHILAYEPGRMYAGRFEAPANAPAAKVVEEAWGVTYVEPLGPRRTRVRLVNCGWGEGPTWAEAEQFFTWGNRVTLYGLIRRLATPGTGDIGKAAGTQD